MDDETREALELTKEDLAAMLGAGEPAQVARRRAPAHSASVTMHSSEPAVEALLNGVNTGQARKVIREEQRLVSA